jgi:hypothetical protein
VTGKPPERYAIPSRDELAFPERARLHRAHHLYRSRGSQDRYSEPQAGARRQACRRGFYHRHIADQSGNVFCQRILSFGRRISRGAG